jgi:carbonic anhydrase
LAGCGEQDFNEVNARAKSKKQEIYIRPEVENADEAINLLKEGNNRFVTGNVLDKDISDDKLEELTGGQTPFTTIISCSDSRVAPVIKGLVEENKAKVIGAKYNLETGEVQFDLN